MHVLHPAMGIASAHRVYRSTMVKRYVMDSDSDCGPTMSTWRDPKHRSGRVRGCRAALTWIGKGDMFGTSCGYQSSFCARQTIAR